MSRQALENDDGSRIHNWLYVIIPINASANSTAYEVPVFTAFCKACRTYFTQTMPWERRSLAGKESPSDLPRYGCKPISEDVQVLP